MSFHILLLASLLFGMLANAAVLHGNRSSVIEQIEDKPSSDTTSSLHLPEDKDYGHLDLVDSNLNHGPDALSKLKDRPTTESLYLPEDKPSTLNHGPVASHQVITRQVLPHFHCPLAPTCAGPTDCLYADPAHCNGFIHCDANGVAWVGYCPMASMIWNDVQKICDYAKEKGDVGYAKAPEEERAGGEKKEEAGEKNEAETKVETRTIAMVPHIHPAPYPQYTERGMYMKHYPNSAAAPARGGSEGMAIMLGLVVVGFAFL